MVRKLVVLSLVLSLLVAALPSLAQDSEAVTVIPAGQPVVLGIATDLSNLIPAPGQDIANGAILAINQFNEAGLLEGFTVEYDLQDDRCSGEDATSVANRFVANASLVAVVGHACSGASIPASEIYNDARIPMISPSSTAVAFTNRGLDVVNRTAYSDGIQGVVAARYISEVLGAESIAILHDNSSYGKGLAETVRLTFIEELGGEVSAFEVVDPEDQDFRAQLTVLAGLEPEVVYFGGYTNQAALLVEQMKEVGLEDAVFFSADGVYNEDFLNLAADNAEGTIVSIGSAVEGLADPALVEEYNAAYEETFGVAAGELGPFNEEAYDAATVILNALVEVAEVDGDGNLVIDREALIQAIRATKDLQGVSGIITCDEMGECGSTLINFYVAEGGEWVALETPEELQVTK